MTAQWYEHSTQANGINRKSFIINNTHIFIGSDPTFGWTEENAKSIDAWVNISDTPCNSLGFVPFKCERYWYPLTEIHRWGYTHAYWTIKVLDSLVFEREDIKTIYIHCQAGTRRSPTSFQMWLISLFGFEKAFEIMPDIENNQTHFFEGGRVNELPLDLELFFKLLRFLPKNESLDSILLSFNTLTKGIHSSYIGTPPVHVKNQSKKKHPYMIEKSEIIKNMEYILDAKVFNNHIECQNVTSKALGHLNFAVDFYKKNNCSFDYNDFIMFCANELLKRDIWNTPSIRIKETSLNELSMLSLEVVELKDLLDEIPYPDVSINENQNVINIKIL